MSYIVTGKTIPQGCVTCLHGRFTESHILYCELRMHEASARDKLHRPEECPLIELPEPHGDLIDRDAHIDDMQNHLWDWDSVNGIETKTALKQAISDLRNAPIVIKREDENE